MTERKPQTPNRDLLRDTGKLAKQADTLARRARRGADSWGVKYPGSQNHTALLSVAACLAIAADCIEKAEAYAGRLAPDKEE